MRLLDSAILTIPDLSIDTHEDVPSMPTTTIPAPFTVLASEDYDGDFDFDLDLDDDDDDIEDDDEDEDDDLDDDDDDDDDAFEAVDDEEE